MNMLTALRGIAGWRTSLSVFRCGAAVMLGFCIWTVWLDSLAQPAVPRADSDLLSRINGRRGFGRAALVYRPGQLP